MADNNKQTEKTRLAEEIASRSKRVSRNYASFEVGFLRFFRSAGSFIDKLLFSNRYLWFSSLVLSTILVLALNFGDNQMLTSSKTAEVIDGVVVEVKVNNEIYEVKGIPETVSVTIIGEVSDIQMMQSSYNLGVMADLSLLSEGVHQVKLRPVNYNSKVQVQINPATVSVSIAKKISKSYYFSYEFINVDKADPTIVFGLPVFENDQVYIRAAQATLDEVALVKALIDVSSVEGDFTQDVKMVAYDQQGRLLNVDIMPERMKTRVLISRPSKTVPIEIQPIGEIPDNKAISRIDLDHQSITIYAPNTVLDKIESVVIPLDVTKLTAANLQGSVKVVLPYGVRQSNVDKVHFTIKLGEMERKPISGIALEYINYDSTNFRIAPFNPADASVTVILAGTKENIEKVTALQIRAVLDLATITKGRLSIPIIVSGPNYLVKYTPEKEAIEIEVIGN